jgi:transketolase
MTASSQPTNPRIESPAASGPRPVAELQALAHQLRKTIVTIVHKAGSGHVGGSLSVCDILTILYFRELNVDPQRPDDPDRDRLLLSKGHTCPALYAVLARRGYFPEEELMTLRQTGSRLQGHPDKLKVPGVEISAGSLGMGVSVGIGIALGAKKQGKSFRVWVVTGCGELDEGQNWEAFMAAKKYVLDNLTVIVDYNRMQNDGSNDDIMPLGNVPLKLEAFGWNVIPCDGHDYEDLLRAIESAKRFHGGPSAIVANTIKSKGVPFMENDWSWHGKLIDRAAFERALRELEATDPCQR